MVTSYAVLRPSPPPRRGEVVDVLSVRWLAVDVPVLPDFFNLFEKTPSVSLLLQHRIERDCYSWKLEGADGFTAGAEGFLLED